MKNIVKPKETIVSKILLIRNQKIMIDADLAEFYGVTTKRLNEQVKRNINRFPNDFMFQLTTKEKKDHKQDQDIKLIFAHLKELINPPEEPPKMIGFKK